MPYTTSLFTALKAQAGGFALPFIIEMDQETEISGFWNIRSMVCRALQDMDVSDASVYNAGAAAVTRIFSDVSRTGVNSGFDFGMCSANKLNRGYKLFKTGGAIGSATMIPAELIFKIQEPFPTMKASDFIYCQAG